MHRVLRFASDAIEISRLSKYPFIKLANEIR